MLRCASVLVSFFLVTCCTGQTTDRLQVELNECEEKFPNFNETEFHINETAEETPEAVKCFIHCILEHEGMMKGNEIEETELIRRLQKEEKHNPKLIEAVHECKNVGDQTTCDKAYIYYTCIVNATIHTASVVNFTENDTDYGNL